MAVQNEDDLKQQGKAGGSTLAGSGGAAGAPGQQAVGTGFTNLQKYLSANQGSGAGLADNIISQGQNAVSDAQKSADAYATTWADTGVQNADYAASNATGQIDNAIGSLEADRRNRQPAYDAQKLTYDGPKSANGVDGFNELDEAYRNVKTTATNFGGDMNTQKAGLQKQYGYGSGFGALDTFLGRQDGKDKIQNWSQNVNPGSAQGQIDRVNNAISGGQKSVTDAQGRLKQAITDNVAPLTKPAEVKAPSIPTQVSPGGITQQPHRIPGTGVQVKPQTGPTYDAFEYGDKKGRFSK